mmetsp:Transcript_22863/g.44470  ORF Transcript_22863/g.44470 Transcript_22863/m.44470 type:complete len:378 (-) Transcript_22863:51-1184(-)
MLAMPQPPSTSSTSKQGTQGSARSLGRLNFGAGSGGLRHQGEHESPSSLRDAATAGRLILSAALSPSLLENLGKQRPHLHFPLPWSRNAGSAEVPRGQIIFPLPDGREGWMECFRDLSRTMQGGASFMLGRHCLYPMEGANAHPGNQGTRACDAAFKQLCSSIRNELMAQGFGLSTQGTPVQLLSGRAPGDQVDPAALEELGHHVALHISIGPGMQAVMQSRWPPALWQPLYVVCVGCLQIRVLTFAFVGEPVSGDRPDNKYSPVVLRLTTDDLIAVAQLALRTKSRPNSATVHFATELTIGKAQHILDHVAGLEDELFAAIEGGNWARFLDDERPLDRAGTSSHPLSFSLSPGRWRRSAEEAAPRFPGGVIGVNGL